MRYARNYTRLFPFGAGGITNLDGESRLSGRIGFGPPPDYLHLPKCDGVNPISRHTSFRPMVASFGYNTLGGPGAAAPVPHTVQISLSGPAIDSDLDGGGDPIVPVGSTWRLVLFEGVVTFLSIPAFAVPVVETGGQPYNLQIRTGTVVAAGGINRVQPSTAVVDWEWSQLFNDLDVEFFKRWFEMWTAQREAMQIAPGVE